ncbi:MAG TPA: APC family permease [Gemmatimonadaceae bacterium]|jgi:amino acid transporter|nr:APC family permease [Gemmatimonadaceae bacterium]
MAVATVPGEPVTSPPVTGLKRTMGTRDLVLFNLVAVIGLRWLATSAKSGPSSLTLWVLAAAFFFIPLGLAVSELSTLYPSEGGIYAWTRRRFGEGHGFFCGWCYWIVNVLYYPQLLISTAVIATFAIGQGQTHLADSLPYVLTVTLASLWLAVGLNIVGLSTGKWLQNVGGIGAYITGIIVIGVGAYAFATHHPSANPITAHSLIPNFRAFDEVNLWASIAFAFAGLELAASMGDEIENPRRTLPRAVYLSAPLIVGCYLLGTAAVLWLVPTHDMNIVSGFLQAVDVGARQIGPALWWLAPLAAAAYTIGTIGGVGAWLSGPARVAFVIGLDRYLPPAFGRVHPRWKTPYVAILVQAVVASVILLLPILGKGTTVETFYLALLDAQVLIYFVPFVYLFACILFDRAGDRSDRVGEKSAMIPGGAAGRLLVGGAGMFVTLFAMGVATVHPEGETELVWAVKVVGGAGVFFLLGGFFYWRGARRTA